MTGYIPSSQYSENVLIIEHLGRVPGEQSEILLSEVENISQEPPAKPTNGQSSGTSEVGPRGE